MQKVILNINTTELTSDMFNAGAAIYIVRRNYVINSKVVLPKGSELQIEEGSVALTSYGDINQPNGIYLLCSSQKKLVEGEYNTFGITSRSTSQGYTVIGHDKDSDKDIIIVTYQPTLTKFLLPGDYIRNPLPATTGVILGNPSTEILDMRLTAKCRIMLPDGTSREKLHVTSNKKMLFKLTANVISKCRLRIAVLSACSNARTGGIL